MKKWLDFSWGIPYLNSKKTQKRFAICIGKYTGYNGYWLVVDLFGDWSAYLSFSNKHVYFGTHNNGHLGWGLFDHLWFGTATQMPDFY